MTIGSVEDLERMPVDSRIRVVERSGSSNDWTRVAEGWTLRGAVLQSEMFSGLVIAGCVSDAATLVPIAGQWRATSTFWYYVLHVDAEAGQMDTIRVRRATGEVSERRRTVTDFEGSRYV